MPRDPRLITPQRAGANFQKVIVASATVASGVRIRELPPCGARFIKGGSILQEIPCDFIGVVAGGGRGLFFDAKSTEGDGLDVYNPKIIKPHQEQFLMTMRDAGAIAGFLVEWQAREMYLWLDARNLWVYKYGRDASANPRTLAFASENPIWWPVGDTRHLVNFRHLVRHYDPTHPLT